MRCTLDSIDEKLGSSESGGGSEVFRVLRAINIIESTMKYEVGRVKNHTKIRFT